MSQVVRLHGGVANGIDIKFSLPLLGSIRYPVPRHRLVDMPKPQEYVEYNLIPGVGYFTADHPQWQEYLRYCHEVTMQEVQGWPHIQ